VFVVDFVDEHLNRLGAHAIGFDKRRGDAGDKRSRLLEIARGLLDGDDRHGSFPVDARARGEPRP
jgi:hypothetical protein